MSNTFKDKYFSIVGDSISTLEGYIPYGYKCFYLREKEFYTNIYTPKDTWWGQVIEHFGASLLVDNAWSGSFVCLAPWMELESCGCSDARTQRLDRYGITPDHVIVYIGTNDRGAGFALTSDDKNDLVVVENAYGVMLDKIKKNYPEAKIWCCTLPKTTCKHESVYGITDESLAEPTRAFRALITKVAAEKDCTLIDLYDNEIVCDTLDGLHPSADGMRVIANKVICEMEDKS